MLMQYDQEAGVKAGAGGVTESGAYVGDLFAKLGVANTGTKFLEFTLKTDSGEARYLSAYYEKSDGTVINNGKNLINAVMGLLKLPGINEQAAFDAEGKDILMVPEFEGKRIGFVLQKVLYTKNDGSDGYKFEIKMPFSAVSRKTLKEALSSSDAITVDKMLETLKDKDDRTQSQAPGNPGGYGNQGGGQVDQYEDVNF